MKNLLLIIAVVSFAGMSASCNGKTVETTVATEEAENKVEQEKS